MADTVNAIGNMQKVSYQDLIENRIPEIIRNSGCEVGDYDLTLEPMAAGNSIPVSEDGTDYYSIKMKCVIRNRVTSESVDFYVELMKLPILQELGFKIRGSFMQQLDIYERTTGWNFYKDKSNGECANLIADNKRSIYLNLNNKYGPCVRFLLHGENKKAKIRVSTFFRAISNSSNEELISLFGYNNPYVIAAFGAHADNRTIDSCIRDVAVAILNNDVSNRTILTMKNNIEMDLFSSRYLPLGSNNASRLNYYQSFSYRANGRSLAKTVECNGYRFEKGIILSANELAVLDKLPINELQVEYNDKIYHLKKFSKFTFDVLGYTLAEDVLSYKSGTKITEDMVDQLNASDLTSLILSGNKKVVRRKYAFTLEVEDLYTAFSIWVDNLNGFGKHSQQFEISNRVLLSYDKKAENLLRNAISTVIENVSNKLRSTDYRGQLAAAITGCNQGIDTDAFINSITNASNNAGQMADMCNVIAYTAKSGKATANLGKATATDEMVNVQDMQEGRLDPLDVPESDKIGSVHYRTLLSKLSPSGDPMSPFLKVVNGEVISDEPVYLTAIEETDMYIAEWDETFHNEDGSLKNRIRVRCNGAVTTVETARVLYKEYSPYQNLSASHSMVPFTGHSAGKRITMACNQAKQAVPFADGGDRPYTNSGGESLLGAGTITADSILNDFYMKNKHLISESEAEVKSSDLKLSSITSEYGKRTFYFNVENVKSGASEAVVTVPYGFRTYEATMFSFKLNPKTDGVYHPGEIVLFNNGYDIEKKDLVMCADFGAQKIDTSVFETGISLTRNLNVVYKTFEGSVIEDGITISSALVYDDRLTNIEMYEISDVAARTEDNQESFGIDKNSAPEYLGTNGLPAVGTYLKPGMIAISKCSSWNGEVRTRYKKVGTYTEGQVIYAGFATTQKGLEATVILAKRAYVNTGDKMAGRCGNKGVIAKIVDETCMPYCADTGEVADIVLNPLGVPSRMNITQLLDGLLSYCMKLEGKVAIVTPYNKNDVDFVRERAKADNVYPRVMIDGRTGRRFERQINFCVLPMYKLHHTADKKIHSVGMDAKLDSTFLQPTKGSKMNGGQSIGEMETWCLESVGATKLLNELFTLQSDDIRAQHQYRANKLTGDDDEDIKKHNSNDLAMQACYRSMGVEFSTDADSGCYTFEPLTDDVIKSLSISPVTNKSMLHATSIFGSTRDVLNKADNRSKWGWIDLHTKMILPLWIYKAGISKIVGISNEDMKRVIAGNSYLCMTDDIDIKIIDKESLKSLKPEESEACETGMSALVNVFERFNTVKAEIEAFASYNNYVVDHSGDASNSTAQQKLARYRLLSDFNKSKKSLKDYVVTSFPVMPQTYRPELKISGRNTVPDFDWFYTQILRAASEVEKNKNCTTERDLFYAILEFTGLDEHHVNKSYKSLLKFFCAKGQKGQHGKIRENIQSKRIMCSGRCAIIPAADTKRTPLEIGVPFTMMVNMFKDSLYAYFLKQTTNDSLDPGKFGKLMLYIALRDHSRFDAYFAKHFATTFTIDFKNDAYNVMTALVIEFLEGRNGNPVTAVCAGRQPSLHKYSVRAFRPYVVFDNVAHLHPLLCTGFNADFDGDQMYFFACLTGDVVYEALAKLSPSKDLILPKDGSIVLKHSQDIVLGVYAATMLKDNALTFDKTIESAYHYHDLEELKSDLEAGMLNTYDLCVYSDHDDRHYCSTVGRILFNGLLPDGFTDKPFSNVLGLSGLKIENYCDLKYDGLVGSGGAGKGASTATNYYSLPAICKDVYERYEDECIDVYQAITEFGFKISDLTGVSLSLYDFDIKSNKQEILEEAEKTKIEIEQDYQDGLIAEEDKRNAVIALYGDSKEGANAKILKDILKNLPRSNNIFIMMDSGARGNKSQVMQMIGCVGILQKSKTEDLETSVTKNYYEGLNSFDVHLTSYSARTGVASSQNETKRSGYATHKVVYMASGSQIVESDCNATDQKFTIEWDDHDPSKDRFMPTKEWYNENLLGRRADSASKATMAFTTNGKFEEGDFAKLQIANGFHELCLEDRTLIADVFNAKGTMLSPEDTIAKKYLKHNKNKYKLSISSINELLKHKVSSVQTADGTYTVRYNMSACCRSLMNQRVAYDLPDLKFEYDTETGEVLGIVTDDTIKFIEDNKIDSINMRTTLQCRSKYGFCAHCYGLKYSDHKFPKVGEFVGTESAQSIAEPASQLTLNVINKGGAAGASSVTSGVQIFDDLLSGTQHDDRMSAIVTDHSGYASITRLDKLADVAIIPESKSSRLCTRCIQLNKTLGCPRGSIQCKNSLCTLKTRVPYNSLCVQDGEWVNAGDKLTNDMIHPNSIVYLDEMSGLNSVEASELLHVRKQRVWIANYFNTFKDSGIYIFARHFEIIANIQNRYVQVLDAGDTDKELGKIYEFNELRNELGRMKVKQFVSKRSDVVLRNSGAFAALSFENVAEVAAKLVSGGYREDIHRNHSLISALSIGENLTTPELKVLNKPLIKRHAQKAEQVTKREEEQVSTRLAIKEVEDVAQDFSLGDIDFESEMKALTAFDSVTEDFSAVTKEPVAKDTTEDEISDVDTDYETEKHRYDPSEFTDYDDEDEFAESSENNENLSKQQSFDNDSYKNVQAKELNAF